MTVPRWRFCFLSPLSLSLSLSLFSINQKGIWNIGKKLFCVDVNKKEKNAKFSILSEVGF